MTWINWNNLHIGYSTPSKKNKMFTFSIACLWTVFFFISARAISDTYSNNHNLVDQVLSELSVKFGEKQVLVIPKNKPYSITKLSEVLIKEPDYVYFHYVDKRGTKEIEIEKQFNVSIRFSCSSQPIPNCSGLNLKFGPNQDKQHHKGTFLRRYATINSK